MRQFTTEIFDEIIVGTTPNWYTPATHNDQLGSADYLTFHAVTTNVSGTTPKLSCGLQHSCDGRNWVNVKGTNPPELDAKDISNDASLIFRPDDRNLLSLLRVRIFLTVTSGTPQCRLKLLATGRVQRAGQAAQPGMGSGRGPMRNGGAR